MTSPWTSFDIDGTAGAQIQLCQVDRGTFALRSTIRYRGETGLEGLLDPALIDDIREITPDDLPYTDLTSVPVLFRWFAGRYGSHTPAALIHDRYIGDDHGIDELTDPFIDRYFRFMLQATGVRWLKRWIMWSAVAARSRWHAGNGWLGLRRWMLIAWILLSIAGTTLLIWSAVTGQWGWFVVALLAPALASPLWGRQIGAGLVMAYAGPFIVPPAILAAVAVGIYTASEWFVGLFLPDRVKGDEDLSYSGY